MYRPLAPFFSGVRVSTLSCLSNGYRSMSALVSSCFFRSCKNALFDTRRSLSECCGDEGFRGSCPLGSLPQRRDTPKAPLRQRRVLFKVRVWVAGKSEIISVIRLDTSSLPRQELHADNPHGPWAFVLSLTDWERRRFSGGETAILQPHVLDYWRGFEARRGMELEDLVG